MAPPGRGKDRQRRGENGDHGARSSGRRGGIAESGETNQNVISGATRPFLTMNNDSSPQTGTAGSAPGQKLQSQISSTLQENAILQNFAKLPMPSDGEVVTCPRPGYASIRDNVLVYANHFPLHATKSLYLYELQLDPAPDSNHKRIIQQRFEKLVDSFPQLREDAIRGSQLISPRKLHVEDENFPFRPSSHPHEDYLKFVKEVTVHECLNSFSRRGSTIALGIDLNSTTQLLNIVLGKYPSSHHVTLDDNKYFLTSSQATLISGVIGMNGFYSSVRPTGGGLTCNINVCTSAFLQPGNLREVMCGLAGIGVSAADMPDGRRISISPFLQKAKVEYDNGKKKFVRAISSILADNACSKVFNYEGCQISVQEYFLKVYNYTLRYPQFCLVDIGSQNRPMLVPPELCTICQGQRYRGKGPQLSEEMFKLACMNPSQSRECIETYGMKTLGHDVNENMATAPDTYFGVVVVPKMITVPSRVIPAPTLQYQKSQQGQYQKNQQGPPKFQPRAPSSGKWNLAEAAFYHSVSKPRLQSQGSFRINIAIINLSKKSLEDVKDFFGQLKSQSTELGLILTDHYFPQGGDIDTHLQVIQKKSWKHKIALVILPSKDKRHYTKVKYSGDVKYGIATVCLCMEWNSKKGKSGTEARKVKPDNVKPSKETLTNIAMKINVKTGGVNHRLSPRSQTGHRLLEKTVMIMGMDLTHASPGSLPGAPSIAGVVASCDNFYFTFLGSMKLQQPKDQGQGKMIAQLKEMTIERLETWQKRNPKTLPESILVYRNGVSEGEYKQVLEIEFPQIEAACQTFKDPNNDRKSYRPKISLIVVAKRHHTRFYPEGPIDKQPDSNPPAGTTVDRGVTDPHQFDWYTQSHHGRLGTSRPAHYIVLKDENDLGAEDIQVLTHNLCHLYSRCPLSVSVCPPAKYADLLCDRGRLYIHDIFHPQPEAWKITSREATWEAAKKKWGDGVNEKLKNIMFYV